MGFSEYVKDFLSVVRALFRFVFITIIFIVDGLQNIIFTRREINDFEFYYGYLKSDVDKMSYIEKLNNTVSDGEDDSLIEAFSEDEEDEDSGEDDIESV